MNADTVRLLRFAQWSLLDYARQIEDSRAVAGRPVPIASNVVRILRRDASIAADLIEQSTTR